jgi:hypothetical protein
VDKKIEDEYALLHVMLGCLSGGLFETDEHLAASLADFVREHVRHIGFVAQLLIESLRAARADKDQ